MPEASKARHRVGLIVNPLAGIGGRVGLKGSDGTAIVERALALGAVPAAGARAAETLSHLRDLAGVLDLGTCPAEMGAEIARETGFESAVVDSLGGTGSGGRTTGEDTRRAALDLREWGAELIVFAGGDGTARDLTTSIAATVPVIGIPAGVKIHSGVFAVSPRHAADVIGEFLAGRARLEEREVLDIDEDLFRAGIVAPRLYGYLTVPCVRDLVQRAKSASRSDPSTARGVAFGVVGEMERDRDAYFILGPGSTVKAVGDELQVDKTLLGVDLYHDGRLIGTDLNESQLLAAIEGHHAKIVVTVIGGQGYIFGRGNQQLSPQVIQAVGRDNIMVIATLDKLHALGGPLRVDTGDPECDQLLAGYFRVITGERERAIWQVRS
jgi:predicted polyphosphate/ATP-dependent NAD kinase